MDIEAHDHGKLKVKPNKLTESETETNLLKGSDWAGLWVFATLGAVMTLGAQPENVGVIIERFCCRRAVAREMAGCDWSSHVHLTFTRKTANSRSRNDN